MKMVTSVDGTAIAYEQVGSGPPLVLVGAAFNDRSGLAPLAQELEGSFTIFNYDRRGRGDSGDTAPYSVEREIEDLSAMIDVAGGTAAVFGYSSGATLTLKAAARGLPITKLALYEPPFLVDDSRSPLPQNLPERLADLTAADRRGDAVELYQREYIGIPKDVVVQMRQAPFRPALEAIAHTLVYDATIVGDLTLPKELIASISTPTLVVAGENSAPVMRSAACSVAAIVAVGVLRTLEGQAHEIAAAPTAAIVKGFLAE